MKKSVHRWYKKHNSLKLLDKLKRASFKPELFLLKSNCYQWCPLCNSICKPFLLTLPYPCCHFKVINDIDKIEVCTQARQSDFSLANMYQYLEQSVQNNYPHAFLKKRRGYCNHLHPLCYPPEPLDEIQPNLVCELLAWMGRATALFSPAPRGPSEELKGQLSLKFK